MMMTALNRILAWKVAIPCLCALAALCFAQIVFARGGVRYGNTTGAPPSALGYSTMLEQCDTSTVQSERSATFAAQMVATGATQRMEIKIELQQRLRRETEYHTIVAPNLGVWRGSEPGVRIDKYVQQVTNLTAPAAYRALVRFRWLDGKGHIIKRSELYTPRCLQPLPPEQVNATPTSGA
jgi:hypothetical protein